MDDFIHIASGENYERVTQIDGVRTTYCRNRFEVIALPHGEVNEQQAVQAFRDWVRWRKEQELRDAGGVPI